jgi:hypothetical protein
VDARLDSILHRFHPFFLALSVRVEVINDFRLSGVAEHQFIASIDDYFIILLCAVRLELYFVYAIVLLITSYSYGAFGNSRQSTFDGVIYTTDLFEDNGG